MKFDIDEQTISDLQMETFIKDGVANFTFKIKEGINHEQLGI